LGEAKGSKLQAKPGGNENYKAEFENKRKTLPDKVPAMDFLMVGPMICRTCFYLITIKNVCLAGAISFKLSFGIANVS